MPWTPLGDTHVPDWGRWHQVGDSVEDTVVLMGYPGAVGLPVSPLWGWLAWGPSGDILILGRVCRGDTLTLGGGHRGDALSLGGGHRGTGVTPWLTGASPSPQSKAH